MPTLSLPTRGCMGQSLTFGHPTTPSPTPPPLAGLAWLPRARLQPPPSYPPPCPSTNHRPTTAQLRRRRYSLKMSATRSQRRDRPTIPSSIILPALPNFRLSGARVALSRSKNTTVPSEQTLQLWAHTRGLVEGGNWRGVRADKITSLYTADSQAAAFAAQSRPSVFPLNESAAKRADFLAPQQTRLGAAAHALCTALTRLHDVTETALLGGPSQALDIFSADPVTPDGRAELARMVSDYPPRACPAGSGGGMLPPLLRPPSTLPGHSGGPSIQSGH